ncbi:hypothetical protein RJT34_12248 [Clitoria ternatea]|uniref:RNase H type-1 domain-containing protein n=1 Tax=Clitoria ternatea TaxID=43366 RepID=A0AAN9PJ54_CLITE
MEEPECVAVLSITGSLLQDVSMGSCLVLKRHWQPPDIDEVKANVDGSWIPGLDKMSGEGVVRCRLWKWISGFSCLWGRGNELMAELLAIEAGLKHVWE